jgi:hypothetical protein
MSQGPQGRTYLESRCGPHPTRSETGHDTQMDGYPVAPRQISRKRGCVGESRRSSRHDTVRPLGTLRWVPPSDRPMNRFLPGLLVVAMCACTPGSAPSAAEDLTPSKALTRSKPQTVASTIQAQPMSASTGRARTVLDGKLKAVQLRIRPAQVVQGEAPRTVLVNVGEGQLGYSFGFKLERKGEEQWRWVNRRQAFPLPLFYLAPGRRSDPEKVEVFVDMPKPITLRPGLYRVTKSLDLAPGKPRPPRMDVSATFRVTRR